MRITNNILSQNLLRNLEAAQGRMDDLQNEMSSGHRITKPSDDPVGIENALRIKSNISRIEQWKNNADEAVAYMSTADTTMADMGSMLQRVRELAVQGASDVLDVNSRVAIKQEVDQIAEQLRVVANTKIGNKYIFAGTATDKSPLSSSWVGNSILPTVEVGDSVSLSAFVDGKALFRVTNANPKGIFSVLDELSSALGDNNGSAVGATIGELDTSIDNVLAQRSDLGARLNRATALQSQLDSSSTNLQQNLSGVQDADMAKTIVDFKNQENVYRSALAIGAQIIQPSLVDFMK